MPTDVEQPQPPAGVGTSTFPNIAEWLSFARSQIGSANRVAELHLPDNGMCTCSRPLPCVHLESLVRRRNDYERVLAALNGPTLVLPIPPPAEAVPAAGVSSRRWWRRRS